MQLCVNIVSGEAVQRSGGTAAEHLEPVCWFCYSVVPFRRIKPRFHRLESTAFDVWCIWSLVPSPCTLPLSILCIDLWLRRHIGVELTCVWFALEVCISTVQIRVQQPTSTPETPAMDGRPVVQ